VLGYLRPPHALPSTAAFWCGGVLVMIYGTTV
jgi:hypothetical protein